MLPSSVALHMADWRQGGHRHVCWGRCGGRPGSGGRRRRLCSSSRRERPEKQHQSHQTAAQQALPPAGLLPTMHSIVPPEALSSFRSACPCFGWF